MTTQGFYECPACDNDEVMEFNSKIICKDCGYDLVNQTSNISIQTSHDNCISCSRHCSDCAESFI